MQYTPRLQIWKTAPCFKVLNPNHRLRKRTHDRGGRRILANLARKGVGGGGEWKREHEQSRSIGLFYTSNQTEEDSVDVGLEKLQRIFVIKHYFAFIPSYSKNKIAWQQHLMFQRVYLIGTEIVDKFNLLSNILCYWAAELGTHKSRLILLKKSWKFCVRYRNSYSIYIE